MLIEFRVSNFRSIGEEQVLSLVPATNQKEYPDNILSIGKHYALNVIAIYGANGSGKSNLLKAYKVFDYMVRNSARTSSTEELIYDPFILREGWDKKPTRFELTFTLAEFRYRYGFEYTDREISKEWLSRKGIGREVNVFQRERDVIDPSSGLKGNNKVIEAAIEATRSNALFIAMLDTLNVEEASQIFKEMIKCIHLDGIKTDYYGRLHTTWESEDIKKMVSDHLMRLKLGMVEIDAKPRETNENLFEAKDPEYKFFSKHRFYNKQGLATNGFLVWDFFDRESSGSIKALEIGGPVLIALELGAVLVIDEIEAKMHPLLTMDTINLFLNKETNPKNAQLIFATHDTNLLSYCNLRRDQIYFAEKNNWESTEIYSLSDFVYVNEADGKESKERPDTDKEKRYIEGRYGAIPVLGPMAKLKSVNNG